MSGMPTQRASAVRRQEPPASNDDAVESSDSDLPTATDHAVPSSRRPPPERSAPRASDAHVAAIDPSDSYTHDTIPSPPPHGDDDA